MLEGQNASFASVSPILAAILAVNIVNELIKVARRLIVEDTATQAEKTARQRAALSLLMYAARMRAAWSASLLAARTSYLLGPR